MREWRERRREEKCQKGREGEQGQEKRRSGIKPSSLVFRLRKGQSCAQEWESPPSIRTTRIRIQSKPPPGVGRDSIPARHACHACHACHAFINFTFACMQLPLCALLLRRRVHRRLLALGPRSFAPGQTVISRDPFSYSVVGPDSVTVAPVLLPLHAWTIYYRLLLLVQTVSARSWICIKTLIKKPGHS